MRLPSIFTLNADGSTSAQIRRGAAFQSERFTPEVCGDPKALAAALSRVQQGTAELASLVAADLLVGSILYRGFAAGSAGAKLTIHHGLGRFAQWLVVGFRGASTTAGSSLVEDTLDTSPITDTNTLALRSYVAGTVDLLVF